MNRLRPHDSGALKSAIAGKVRERKCIVSGDILPEWQMIRFVANPQDHVVPDIGLELPGRGMWVTATADAVAAAVKRKGFSRSAKRPLHATAELPAFTGSLLAQRWLQHLGLARRAGAVVTGLEKTRRALENQQLGICIEASDGAEDGRRRIIGACRNVTPVPRLVGCFSSSELSLALGGANVVHAGVNTGRFSDRLCLALVRLSGFRPLVPDAWAAESRAAADMLSDPGLTSPL